MNLVYGALATLALILLVAVYALATKGSIQSELERKLDLLAKKDRDLRRNEDERDRALGQYRDAQEKVVSEKKHRRTIEDQRDQYKEEFDNVNHQKADYESESERLRRKLWDKDDQAKLEELEKKSEEDLMKELEEEGGEFFGSQHELADEKLDGEDDEDLQKELKVAKEFEDQFKHAKGKLEESGDEGDEEALEGLEELGEQNEVYLDELDRDAKRNTNKKWKDPKRAAKMGGLAKEMDLHAEALRNKYNRKRLAKGQKDFDGIEAEASKEAKDDHDTEYAPKIREISKELEGDEERLMRELDDVDEPEEFDAAKMLEDDAEKDDLQLAHLEQLAEDDSKLTPAQKQEREKLIKELEKEINEAEGDAMHVGKGLERRHVRKDAIKMAKAANRLSNQPLQKLKHGKKAVGDVKQILSSEVEMLDAMKKGDVSNEERYGSELNEEAGGLEDDAERLFDEADAGDFDDLDEKLMDEQLARELEDAGDDMEHDAGEVDHGDRERAVRHAGDEIEHEAESFGEAEESFGKSKSVKKDADTLEKEAQELGRAVGEQAWDEEAKLAEQAIKDSGLLDEDANQFESELEGADTEKISAEDLTADKEAVKKMRGAGARLKREAQGVLEDVHAKAKRRQEKLSEQLHEAEQVAKAGHN